MSADEFDEHSTVVHGVFDPSPIDAGFSVEVTGGVDRGRSLVLTSLTPSRVLVGQSPACELRLSDPTVSRRHLALEMTERDVRVTDLDSRNGTFIGNLKLGEVVVCDQAELVLGATTIRIARTTEGLGSDLSLLTGFGGLVGKSTEIRRMYPLFERLAASDVSVIIEGETGTGKEVLAEAIHTQGTRASGPFIVFDCTAVPPTLMESELFGHERGSFTGAVATHKGVFERAHDGTLLIDEIGELELTLQPKLLRALEKSEVTRVGAERSVKVDVRVLAATRRDLDREVQLGRFRDDLFHRLAVARVELPALRKRRGDVTILANHFMQGFASGRPLPRSVTNRWEEQSWPGNVRELRNAVLRYIALGELESMHVTKGAPLTIAEEANADIDPWVEGILAADMALPAARQQLVEEFERRYIQRVLERHDGNVGRAAEAAGVAKRYFQFLKARAQKRG